MDKFKNITIATARKGLDQGDFTATDLVNYYLDNIKNKDTDIHAYLEVFADALEQAKLADEKIAKGEKGELLGIPFSIKDNILFKGHKASASSKMLENYTATYDATGIKKLKDAGVIILGRTNMDEFAMGSSTENSAFGPTKNPVDLSRVPGGSSGGAAASVAGDMTLMALGTDTGGSVRQPASFCGVVGLMPTYGAISRYGIMAMGSSLDQIGPVGKTVTDVETVFKVLKGQDRYDGTTLDYSFPEISKDKKLKIGVPTEILKIDGVDETVRKNFAEAIETLKKNGHEVKDVSMPNLSYALSAYYILMPAEVSSNLARFDGVKYGLHKDGKNMVDDYFETRREGFGKEVRRRILLGTYVLSSGYYDSYYNKANIVRQLISKDYDQAFEQVDVIITPTTPTPAFKFGEKTANPLEMYLADIFTVPVNIVGVPAISVPCGFKEVEGKKLPLGLQFTAPKMREDLLFHIGKNFLNE
ncbi:MAG: Asp-tRNA(Asn)/Glu-tRNA(Gln) amidotransferase subunit GatA [Minisyncoccia bacterium]